PARPSNDGSTTSAMSIIMSAARRRWGKFHPRGASLPVDGFTQRQASAPMLAVALLAVAGAPAAKATFFRPRSNSGESAGGKGIIRKVALTSVTLPKPAKSVTHVAGHSVRVTGILKAIPTGITAFA